jgi:hypothetical protein
MTDCKECRNRRAANGLEGNCVLHCINFEPKLPKVTIQEVGMKYWEMSGMTPSEFISEGCDSVKDFYGVGINSVMGCSVVRCASKECIQFLTNYINKERGH